MHACASCALHALDALCITSTACDYIYIYIYMSGS